jgi:hypothetical protein
MYPARIIRHIGVLVAVAGFTMGLGANQAAAQTPSDTESVTLCHATGSATNPYVVITVDAAGAYNGHLGIGPGQEHQGSEDIIPPFIYQGTEYSQNWDAAGQAIFEADCLVAQAPTATATTAPPTATNVPVEPTATTAPGEPTATTAPGEPEPTDVPVQTLPETGVTPSDSSQNAILVISVLAAVLLLGTATVVGSRSRR